MPLYLPESCPRGLKDCEPLSQILVDDKDEFICCGLNDGTNRVEKGDIFRHCWKSIYSYTTMDYDQRDIIDLVSVLMQGLSVKGNSENNELD